MSRLRDQLENGRALYCACLERFTKGRWEADFVYLHADSTGHAHAQICASEPNRQLVRIVAVAPVVGYHAQDDHGDTVTL